MQIITDWTFDRSTCTADINTDHGPTLELNCGSHDHIEIYHESATRWFYVLTWNHRLPYIALQAYDVHGEPIAGQSRFFQEWQAQRLIDELPADEHHPHRPDWNAQAAARTLLDL